MSLQIEKRENSMALLTIEVPASELAEAIENAYHRNKGKISTPGFRKGKVPRQMIEKLYGKEIFYEDAANELIPGAYERALDECEEEIVSSPKIEVVHIEAGEPFVFTAEVALKPEIKLGKYKGVKVAKFDNSVSDDEIDAAIEKERERNARNIVVENRAVEDGDMTIIDFEGFVDDIPFQGGKGEDYALTIGSGTFIPGFESQLIGAEIGKEISVNVTFPEDYQAEDLAGKDAVFKCMVKEIKEKELPELDDEFASEVSEFDTLDEYKADLKAKLIEGKEKANKEQKEDACIDAVINDSDIEIPEPMLETQKHRMVEEFTQNIRMQGLNLEQYFQYTGMDYKSMVEHMTPQADKRIRIQLVLEAVAAKEKLVASDEEYNNEIARMAESYEMEVELLEEKINEDTKKRILKDLSVRKAVEFIVKNSKEE
ncbi:MAG: trigger factor [Lachnospiraceae bacterium]|nr:trigger factor [Lachnospiraceae bacterium]